MSHAEGSGSSSGTGDRGGAGTKPRLTDVLFDLRTVIGALFAVYGLVCTIWGLTSFTDADKQRTGGVNLNLWAGLGMLAVAAFFLVWSTTRPVLPKATDDSAHAGPDED